ncbi:MULTISPECIES: hypothetical protein [unclassified Pseudoalteromonas]|uniref:hypothetical protein n=1 Tax=unclassified Pseudoalteromonas TaxID=194690 RepID=UPI002096B7F0|nr:hypothetical protein [Pseudoalteromonas sp. XMcav2-N]MCO7191240.1 hypothetical protein [Pseudoalteromonas sp. XMcav2-N]
MKMILMSIGTTLLSVTIYFISFSMLWDKIIPYYYEDHLTSFFVSGLIFIMLAPFLLSACLYFKSAQNFRSHYYNALKKTSIAFAVFFILIVLFQFIEFSGIVTNEGYYKIESSGE